MHRKFISHLGFSLMEVIFVIIILGTFVSLSLINYSASLEKSKSVEGIQILRTLIEAQMAYKLEHGNFSNNLGDLAVTIPVPKNFNNPSVSSNSNAVATIQRSGSYTLTIDDESDITCVQGSGPADICTRIGY